MSGSMRDALGLRQAATMGNYTRHTTTSTTPETRYCPRCNAKISRYAAHTETLCAPCAASLHPWTPPSPELLRARRRAAEWETTKGTRCKCGGPKSAGARSCVRCYLIRIGAHHPAYYGPICSGCGGPKRPEARQCHHCRYPKSVA